MSWPNWVFLRNVKNYFKVKLSAVIEYGEPGLKSNFLLKEFKMLNKDPLKKQQQQQQLNS